MDLKAQAQSRIAWQYRNAEKFREWIDVLPGIAQGEIEDPLARIADVLDTENAEGSILDIAGRIVGQGREYRTELDRNTNYCGEADMVCGASGAYLTATSETISQESEDSLYRILIRAKIARNNGDATLDQIVRAVKFFVDIEGVDVIDYEDMSFDVILRDEIKPQERFVLRNFRVVPKPQGVRFNGFIETKIKTLCGEAESICGREGEQCGATYYGAL